MANKTILGTVLGIAFGLVVLCLIVWLLAKYKQQYKYKKGKIVYECVLTPDPTDRIQSTGQCTIKGRSDNNPSQFSSMADCQTKCGTFYQCYPAGLVGNYCGKTGENINGAFSKTIDECNKTCNSFNPPPGQGTVSSGRYLIKSYNSLSTDATKTTSAYLCTYFDCGRPNATNQVYPLIDPNATEQTADIWIYDQGTGTLKSNMRYTNRGVRYIAGSTPPTQVNPNCSTQYYAYPDQDLYLSLVACAGSDSIPLVGIMLPFGTVANSCNNVDTTTTTTTTLADQQSIQFVSTESYTTGWYLAMSKSLGGQIARSWNQPAPQDYVCLDSIFPRSGGTNPLPYAQPATFCRNVGTCYNYTFIPVL